MSVVTSRLSEEQQKKLHSLFGHVRLHLLYKASVHSFTAAAFHNRCDSQGPTVIVAYNAAGFVFGAYTSKNYTQCGQPINDQEAFVYSITAGETKPLRVAGIAGQSAFTDCGTGPNYGALVFLHEDQPAILSNPGAGFNFQAAAMHGENLDLTELEVFRVEGLGDLLPKPWRDIQWTAERKHHLMKFVHDYKPEIKAVHQARVLLVGPVGAGNYTIKAGKGGELLPLILCDTMGLEQDAGLETEDIVSICKGHVKDRYQFSPSAPLQENSPGYKKNATLADKIHCVVYVVDASKGSILTQKMLDKFIAIRRKNNQLGIPQIILMTKVDEACPLVAQDLRNVYRSVYIQKVAQQLNEALGITLSCILPVKNYSKELNLDQDMEILLFTAVEQMLNYSDSFFENLDSEDINDQPDLYRSNDYMRPVFSRHTETNVV
ncbi:hypothetical protein Q5P01_020684 [Channa striata]|uniref:TLDc domain-containing protein n=1 Tax=Channa striata TaxID=64152 RepID=A0AA88M0E8_CHASR|nr:hypothetical protein Q5P01_020684 [Channa striata]